MNPIWAGIGGAGALFMGAAVALQVAGQFGPSGPKTGESVDNRSALQSGNPGDGPSDVQRRYVER